MKKKFIMFLMTVMLSFSAVCFASYGTDLDAETKAVDQFFAGTDYKKAAAIMDADLAKNLTADKYKEMFASMDKELGNWCRKIYVFIMYSRKDMFSVMLLNSKKRLKS